MDNYVLGCRIRELRESKGITQEELASVLDISRQAFIRLEQGKRSISFIDIERIANHLGIHYSEITEVNEAKDLSLRSLCRDEYSANTEEAFQAVQDILDVFSAQEKLFYQMNEGEKNVSRTTIVN
jgi:transcriptional regulator with XRE-family HTH domain